MGEAVRAFDWSKTPLGPPAEWPAALKIAVGLILSSEFPKCIVWGPELTAIYNDAFVPILGDKPEPLGRPFCEIWSEAWEQIGPIATAAFEGRATFIEDYPLVVHRGENPEQAYFTFCYSPIRDEHGRTLGMMDTVIETTAKVEAEKQVALVNAELAHRMKNTISVISAIINQTLIDGVPLDVARTSLEERLAVLGNAHASLTQSRWVSAPVRDVVEGALVAHVSDGERVTLSGPNIQLPARQAMTLALAVNELATNASKYGALSDPNGNVSIAWSAPPLPLDGSFRFTWIERGGPSVVPPTRTGFGSLLIERIMARDFGGKVKLDYAPTGLTCELETAMARLRQ